MNENVRGRQGMGEPQRNYPDHGVKRGPILRPKVTWRDLPTKPPDDPIQRDRMALDALSSLICEAGDSWSDEAATVYMIVGWTGRKVPE